ncbi:hypothetical protein [Oceanobacillus sp. J11TS1]|uniref:hypothetical protein n=1 Tax=Oceanobacillus sp. J11TS1 TaxID=2807191 RepID=UPI001B06B243|nr:hypothetical protein [Oceanobacillus sp. J11TS1]GIO23476.1 hypothetical protein J11TS1_20570 [Oceanobacillus sp. J11TS1]
MVLSFNLSRIDGEYIDLYEQHSSRFDLFELKEEIEEKEPHIEYGERPSHTDVLKIENTDSKVQQIIQYAKDKENEHSVRLMESKKCCDGIFIRIKENGSASIDVYELKDTISDTNWEGRWRKGKVKGSAKKQLEAGILIAITIANIAGIPKIETINCTLAYAFDVNASNQKSTVGKKSRLGQRVKPWKQKKVDLLEGEAKYGDPLEINMRSVKLLHQSDKKLYEEKVNFYF